MKNEKLAEIQQHLGHHHPLGIQNYFSQYNDQLLKNKSLSFLDLSIFFLNTLSSFSQQTNLPSFEQNPLVEGVPDNYARDKKFQQQENLYSRHNETRRSHSSSVSALATPIAGKPSSQNGSKNIVDIIQTKSLSTDISKIQLSSSQQQQLELNQTTQSKNLNSNQKATHFQQEVKNFISGDGEDQQNFNCFNFKTQAPLGDSLSNSNSLKISCNNEIAKFVDSNHTALSDKSFKLKELTSKSPNVSPARTELIKSKENSILSPRLDLNYSSNLTSESAKKNTAKLIKIPESKIDKDARSHDFLAKNSTNLGPILQKRKEEKSDLYLLNPTFNKAYGENDSYSRKDIDFCKKPDLQHKIENYFQLSSLPHSYSETSKREALTTSSQPDLISELSSFQESIPSNNAESFVANSFSSVAATQMNLVDLAERSKNIYRWADIKPQNRIERTEDITERGISGSSPEAVLSLFQDHSDSKLLNLIENSSPVLSSDFGQILSSDIEIFSSNYNLNNIQKSLSENVYPNYLMETLPTNQKDSLSYLNFSKPFQGLEKSSFKLHEQSDSPHLNFSCVKENASDYLKHNAAYKHLQKKATLHIQEISSQSLCIHPTLDYSTNRLIPIRKDQGIDINPKKSRGIRQIQNSISPIIHPSLQENELNFEHDALNAQQEFDFLQLSKALDKAINFSTSESLNSLTPQHKIPQFNQSNQSHIILDSQINRLAKNKRRSNSSLSNVSRAVASPNQDLILEPPREQSQNLLVNLGEISRSLDNNPTASFSHGAPVEWSNLQDLVAQDKNLSPSILKASQSPESQLAFNLNSLLQAMKTPILAGEAIDNIHKLEANHLINVSPDSESSQPVSNSLPLVVQTNLIEGAKPEGRTEREASISTSWTSLESLVDQIVSISRTSDLDKPRAQMSKIKAQDNVTSKKTVQAKSLVTIPEKVSLAHKFKNTPRVQDNLIQRQQQNHGLQITNPPIQATKKDSYVTVFVNSQKESLSTAQSIEILAQEIYGLLRRRLSIEQERHGKS